MRYCIFADLLKELAGASTPAAIAGEESVLPELRAIVLDHADWLESDQGRRNLLLELMRCGAEHDFETVRASTEWRTYLALQATFMSVEDEQLRDELQAVLAESERAFIGRIARGWQRIGGLFGIRLRGELGVTFETFAQLASADLRGHVIQALASPKMATRTVHAAPFGATEAAEWSLPALAIAGIALAVFEPDPAVTWDSERIAMVRHVFETGLDAA